MSLHYLIDGYNVLYALRDFPKGTWQDKRAYLLAYLRKEKLQGKNPLTVVFDNRQGPGNQFDEVGLRVIYTSGGSADDQIVELVRTASNPRAMVVVSNDQGIRQLIKGSGARFVSATEFLMRAATSDVLPAPAGELIDRDAISTELQKKWL